VELHAEAIGGAGTASASGWPSVKRPKESRGWMGVGVPGPRGLPAQLLVESGFRDPNHKTSFSS
jgi:hypothetical protein